MSQQSQPISESESELELSKFLQLFSPISLHHWEPNIFHPWVFWSESEGCENNSSSPHLATTPMIHQMIKSALSNIEHYLGFIFIALFWAPVTIDRRQLLSTSHQPFAVGHLSKSLAMYRLHSEKYKYNIEQDLIILSGGPAPAFLNCQTSIHKPQGFLLDNDELMSVMVPICFPSQSNCIGVLQFTLDPSECNLPDFVVHTVREIKDAGLDVFYVQHLIPYKFASGAELGDELVLIIERANHRLEYKELRIKER
ncbi:hypothetical protein HanRHA438_Chr02g0081951 [Helianthus annuus]|nr:hypothetical protein HanRHA438_Chr02g0081951 [Helianthus annuus]